MYPAFVLPSPHEPVTFDEVVRAVHCPDQALFVRWAAIRDLIPDLSPPICCREMTLSFGCTSSDGATFRCPVCRRERSIRGDCWLKESKLSLQQAAMMLASWISGRSVAVTAADCRTSTKTVSKYFSEFRNYAERLYLTDLARNPLGGPGKVCQLDESLFCRAKYYRGRALATQFWVFGIVDASTGRVMMEPVDQRDAGTLLPIIQATTAQGSTIWSDQWRAYTRLSALGYAHQTVNHSRQFVAPDGTNTQMIEGCWALCKNFLRKNHVRQRDSVESYIHEWCFRRNLGINFDAAWKALNS